MTVRKRSVARAAAAAFTCLLGLGAASAQEKSISIELNNARDSNNGCSLTFRAVNDTGSVLDKTSYEIVVFDADDKAVQFLIMEFGRLLAGKTKVVAFDFANRACNQISSILVNDASECVAAGAPSPVCLENLKTATRVAEIGFGK